LTLNLMRSHEQLCKKIPVKLFRRVTLNEAPRNKLTGYRSKPAHSKNAAASQR